MMVRGGPLVCPNCHVAKRYVTYELVRCRCSRLALSPRHLISHLTRKLFPSQTLQVGAPKLLSKSKSLPFHALTLRPVVWHQPCSMHRRESAAMGTDNSISKFLFDKMAVPSFRKYLNLGSFRHKLIAGNMANVATPGYKAEDIDFQKEFDRLTTQTGHVVGMLTDENHIPVGAHEAKAPKVNETKIKNGDVNSVDIDQEVADLAQNELLFTIGAELLKRKFDGMRNAITSR